jgi:hypothetical protein
MSKFVTIQVNDEQITGAVRATAQQGQLVNQNLGTVSFLTGFLSSQDRVWILPSMKSWVPFFTSVANILGPAVEGDQVVPLCLIGPVSLAVLLPVGSSKSEGSERVRLGRPSFRRCAET